MPRYLLDTHPAVLDRLQAFAGPIEASDRVGSVAHLNG
jgi:hypothetical protein